MGQAASLPADPAVAQARLDAHTAHANGAWAQTRKELSLVVHFLRKAERIANEWADAPHTTPGSRAAFAARAKQFADLATQLDAAEAGLLEALVHHTPEAIAEAGAADAVGAADAAAGTAGGAASAGPVDVGAAHGAAALAAEDRHDWVAALREYTLALQGFYRGLAEVDDPAQRTLLETRALQYMERADAIRVTLATPGGAAAEAVVDKHDSAWAAELDDVTKDIAAAYLADVAAGLRPPLPASVAAVLAAAPAAGTGTGGAAAASTAVGAPAAATGSTSETAAPAAAAADAGAAAAR